MTITFACDSCGKEFRTDASLAGKNCKCKQCGHIFVATPNRATSSGSSTTGRTRAAEPAARPVPTSRPGADPGRPSSRSRPEPRPGVKAPSYGNDPEDDPYSFDDAEAQAKPVFPEDLEDERLPPRAPAPETSCVKPRRQPASWGGVGDWVDGVPGWAFLGSIGAVVLLAMIAGVSPSGGSVLTHGIMTIVYVVGAIGAFGLIFVAFREGVAWGIAWTLAGPFNPTNFVTLGTVESTLLVRVPCGIYALYYVISRWRKTLPWIGLTMWAVVIGAGSAFAVPGVREHFLAEAKKQQAEQQRLINDQPAPMNPLPPETDQSAANDADPNREPGPQNRPGLNRRVGPAARPSNIDFVAQVLNDLSSRDARTRSSALTQLANKPPDPSRRLEVSRAVEPMLKDPDTYTRTTAAQALAIWGGSENTPTLVEALRDPSFNVVWAVLDAIAALKDPSAAEPVAAHLLIGRDRGKAAEALKGMGSAAEKSVIKYIDHSDWVVRTEVCRILQAIGTEECIPALRALLRRANGSGIDAMAARDALRQLNAPEYAPPFRKNRGATRLR
jgi:hypothetical protein